jgi:paraquat-inducible protein A
MTGAAAGAFDDAALPRLLGCPSCGLVSRDALPASGDDADSGRLERPARVQHCPRCGEVLRARKPMSVQRTWACVIAAAVLYVPANLLPIMTTTQALQRQEHTLLGGIHELWIEGSWGLSLIVFIASIAVPVLKIGVLGLLAWTVQRAPEWRRLERARLYRLIEAVGHWSMLDVYVVVLLGATIHFGPLANVSAGPALLSFAAVVVLTMLATYAFDPKLIWDSPARGRRAGAGPAAGVDSGEAAHAGRVA